MAAVEKEQGRGNRMNDPAPVLAWLRHERPDAAEPCLVCALEPAEVTVSLSTTRSGLVSVIATETGHPAGDVRLADPRGWRPAVLRQAAGSARFRDATVYQDGSAPVAAGELIAAFEAYAAVVRETVGRLVGRVPDAASAGCVVVGGVAGFPLAGGLVAEVLPSARRLNPDPTVDVVRRGRELLDAGTVRFPPTYPHDIALRIREIRDGLLVNGRTVIASAGELAADGRTVVRDGSAVVVEEGAADVEVEVGDAAHVAGPARPGPPPGRYVVGIRLVDGLAELVFRPAGGGAPVGCGVGELPVIGSSR